MLSWLQMGAAKNLQLQSVSREGGWLLLLLLLQQVGMQHNKGKVGTKGEGKKNRVFLNGRNDFAFSRNHETEKSQKSVSI